MTFFLHLHKAAVTPWGLWDVTTTMVTKSFPSQLISTQRTDRTHLGRINQVIETINAVK